jgi:hypothetical protein
MGPELIAIASIATTIGGGIVSAVGASQQAKAQSQMYQYQAAQARINQDIAKQNADYQRVIGDNQAQRHGIAARQRAGAILAQQGASGLKVDGGSAVDIRDSQRAIDLTDQGTIRANAARRAYAYEVGGMEEGNKAAMADASSSNARTAGRYAVASSLLGTATSVSSKWLQGNQMGLWGDN